MKRILLQDRGQFIARDVVTTLIENPGMVVGQDGVPQPRGLTYVDIRKRDKLMRALEASKEPFFDLEDADYEELKRILDGFQFSTGKRDLKLILDDIAHAKSPEETKQLKAVVDNKK